jgi:lipopolysaccharide export system protein LptA
MSPVSKATLKEPSVKIFSFRRPSGTVPAIWLGLVLAALMVSTATADSDLPAGKAADPEAKKIHITADRLISNTADNQAEFTGNVKARQGETEIHADSLKILFSDNSAPGNTSPAQSLEKLVAVGNVEIKFDNRLAVARQAVYITAQRMLVLSGEASVTSGDNTIAGETITFYRDDGRFTVEGGSKGRVKAVILPEDSGLE